MTGQRASFGAFPGELETRLASAGAIERGRGTVGRFEGKRDRSSSGRRGAGCRKPGCVLGRSFLVRGLLPALAVILLLAAILSLAAPAAAIEEATPEPGWRYRVVDVAPGEWLNVRVQADATARIVARLAPDADDVVVTGLRQEVGGGVWWQVPAEGSENGRGWINARYLTPVDPHGARETDFPLRCSGTEPFWSLGVAEGETAFSTPEGEGPVWRAGEWRNAEGRLAGFSFALRLEGGAGEIGHLAVQRDYRFCLDGMSDFDHPFHGLLMAPDGRVYSGCCARAR